MTIVVDANLLVVLISGDPRGGPVRQRLQEWLSNGESLHSPALLPYEVADSLTRLVTAGLLPAERVASAWKEIDLLPIQQHMLGANQEQVVEVALKLRRQSAYDAAYIALAQQLDAELWTLDGHLARNAAGLGFPVNLVT